MSSFDFESSSSTPAEMTYWGSHQDTNFWIENAQCRWKEAETLSTAVGRLTLLRDSQLRPDADEATYFDRHRERTLTAHRLEALIVPLAFRGCQPEKRACYADTAANDQLQRRVRADLEPRRGGDSVQELKEGLEMKMAPQASR